MTEPERSSKVDVTLKNKHGLHARPAHLWVQTANSFAAKLMVRRPDGGEAVDGKSIMGIMMLAAECGTTLELSSEGPDCEDQLRALIELVDSAFGEE